MPLSYGVLYDKAIRANHAFFSGEVRRLHVPLDPNRAIWAARGWIKRYRVPDSARNVSDAVERVPTGSEITFGARSYVGHSLTAAGHARQFNKQTTTERK